MLSFKRHHASWLLATLFMFMGQAANSHSSQTPSIDHYLSYEVISGSHEKHHVSLTDEFIPWTDFEVKKPKRIMNPVVKRHVSTTYEINNPHLHYMGFEIKSDPEVHLMKNVLVTNQFGRFKFQGFKAKFLLAPSRKTERTMLDAEAEAELELMCSEADHYLCYEIPEFAVDGQFGILKDQWQTRYFENMKAKYFCNPTMKYHHDEFYPINNDSPDNHLMCFEIEKTRKVKVVNWLNQFGVNLVMTTKDNELCVPTVVFQLPEPCSTATPDDEGMCNGMCPGGQVCMADEFDDTCFCAEMILCGSSGPDSDGICGGDCIDPAETCLVDPTNNTCICASFSVELPGEGSSDDNGTCTDGC